MVLSPDSQSFFQTGSRSNLSLVVTDQVAKLPGTSGVRSCGIDGASQRRKNRVFTLNNPLITLDRLTNIQESLKWRDLPPPSQSSQHLGVVLLVREPEFLKMQTDHIEPLVEILATTVLTSRP